MMEAKTVKTNEKTESGQTWFKITKLCYYSQESINPVKSLRADCSINNAFSPKNLGAK